MNLKLDFKKIEDEVKIIGFKPIKFGYKVTNNNEIKEFDDQKVFKRVMTLKNYLNYTKNGEKFRSGKSTPKYNFPEVGEINGYSAGSDASMGKPIGGVDPTPTVTIESFQGHTQGAPGNYPCIIPKNTRHSKDAKHLPLVGSNLPKLTDFSEIETLKQFKSSKPSLVIGFDTEWVGKSDRTVISWQFSLVWGDDLIQYIFLNSTGRILSLNNALSLVLSDLNYKSYDSRLYRRFKAVTGFNDATNAKYEVFKTRDELIKNSDRIYPLFKNPETKKYEPYPLTILEAHKQGKLNMYAKRGYRDWIWAYTDHKYPERYDVTLLSHFGRVDLSNLRSHNSIFKRCSEVQGGMVTINYPIKYDLKDRSAGLVKDFYAFPINLSVRDTMGQSPSTGKALEALGSIIGIPKIDDDDIDKSRMDKLYYDKPRLAFEYASRDADIPVLYTGSIYGFNSKIPITLTSAAARIFKNYVCKELKIDPKNQEEYDRVYRGVMKVGKGKVKKDNLPGFYNASANEPISDDARLVQSHATESYHGGFNGSFRIGYYDGFRTYDFDLMSAYPTSMALVPDIDWDDPIKVELDKNKELSLSLFASDTGYNPLIPMFAYVEFEFPEDCKYPCIAVNDDGNIVYPRTSKGMNGVYTTGPEIYLALKLGAKVINKRGFILNILHDENGYPSRSMSKAVQRLVKDRTIAKKLFGKHSFEQDILKIVVNSIYGKIAQNVIDKSSWNAFAQAMEDLGASAVTNPVSASLTTAIVRCELIASLNEIEEAGFQSFSVTTDGFITSIPEKELNTLPMYGFRRYIEQSRRFLTRDDENPNGDPQIWEIKHKQDVLLNLTTRGNIAPNPKGDPFELPGVRAYNSLKPPYGKNKDSKENRLWYMKEALKRNAPVAYNDESIITFKELSQGKAFKVVDTERNVRQDFDMKRKPLRSSFETVYPVVDGENFEIADFDTTAYEDINEFRLYKSKVKLCDALRTENQWKLFFDKVDGNKMGVIIDPKYGIEWPKLKSCVMGHRKGLWEIPYLSRTDISVNEKCDWINSFELCNKTFTKSDWKNAAKPQRQAGMLPKSQIEDFLKVLGAKNFKV